MCCVGGKPLLEKSAMQKGRPGPVRFQVEQRFQVEHNFQISDREKG